jgi:hypothetical protein
VLTTEQKRKRLLRCHSAAIEYVNDKRLTVKGLAGEYCIPWTSFYQYLKDNGIERHSCGRHKVNVSPETIYARYLKLGNMEATGRYYGISRQAVSQIFQKAKFSVLPGVRKKKIDINWLNDLRKKGLSNRKVAERMGCGRTLIGELICNLLIE